MTSLEQDLQERLNRNSFMNYNHIELESFEPDRAVLRMEIRPESYNPFGEVHGGAMYALADNAAGCAASSDGRYYVTQTSTMHFISNRKAGILRAAAHIRHRGKSTCLIIIDITSEDGKLIATGEFTFFCVSKQLAEARSNA